MDTSAQESCKIWDCVLGALQNCQFWYGVLAGVVLVLVLLLIWKCISACGATRKEITIEDNENGSFTITLDALISFVRSTAASFNQLEVLGLRLAETRLGLVMVITVTASADTELVKCRNQLREHLMSEMRSKLGVVDQIKAINFEAQQLTTSEKQA